MKIETTHKTEGAIDENGNIVMKLIYFWAFIEAGLGGFLHLLHIPLTGFIVGGFAVIIIVLLAKFGSNKASVFIKALGIVLAVKFLLSPYTPLGAYIAVSFQGLLAVVVFSIFGLNRVTVFFFATIVMMESGIQKPAMAYIVFGKEFLNATLVLLSNTFSMSKEIIADGFLLFLSSYLLLYFIWGVVLSQWLNYLLKNIQHLHTNKIGDIALQQYLPLLPQINNRVNRKHWLMMISIAVFILIIIIPFLAGKISGFYLLRTILMLLLLLLIAPQIIRKHQNVLFKKNKKTVNDIVNNIPEIRRRTQVAWKLAEDHHGLKKIKFFVTYAIWLNVFYEQK